MCKMPHHEEKLNNLLGFHIEKPTVKKRDLRRNVTRDLRRKAKLEKTGCLR